jgi:hypothetical protein
MMVLSKIKKKCLNSAAKIPFYVAVVGKSM